MIKQNYKNKKVINLLVTTLAILVFMSIYGKVYARYILTREFNTDISSAQFYFGVDSVSSNITIQKRPNNTLLTSPKFDLVIHNNDGNNYNSYDLTYNISIVDSENIYFENEVTKTIVGGSKKDENVSINFNIKDIDNIQDTVTIRVTTTKPYSKSVDIKFNIKTEWVIQKIEDLVDFSNKVNEGKTYEGEQVVLLNNLDFNTPSDYENANRLDYHDYNDDGVEEALIDELRKGRGFIPIGYRTEVNNEGEAIDRQEFKGNFDGQNYTISGLYINNNQQQYSTGLFGRTRNATIKNLTVEGNVTTTEYASVGGIIGVDHNSEITNCINRINVSVGMGRYQAAGIVSSANGSIIKNCVNYGNISEGNHTGGIAGIVNEGGAYIISCKNYGKITNKGASVAGIANRMQGIDCKIELCTNYGEIIGNGGYGHSGILSYSITNTENTSEITKCINYGNVSEGESSGRNIRKW